MAAEAQVLSEIARIVAEELGLDVEVTAATRLLEDLQLDSMSLTVLAVGLEDRFRVNLYDDQALAVRTAGELCALVSARCAASAQGAEA
jgi:acyl carrier protein